MLILGHSLLDLSEINSLKTIVGALKGDYDLSRSDFYNIRVPIFVYCSIISKNGNLENSREFSASLKTSSWILWLEEFHYNFSSEALRESYLIPLDSSLSTDPAFSLFNKSSWICLQCRRPGFNSWVRKISWSRKCILTPVFLPGELHRQRNLVCYSPQGCKESDTTDWLTLDYLPSISHIHSHPSV